MPRIFQVSVPSLRVTLSSIFRKQGFNSTDALYLAGTLIDADQRGISSHGTQRMAMYDAKIRHRIIDPHARPGIVRSKGATLLIDAHAAMGQLAMREATNLAIGLAQSHGLGLVTVRNSNHFGTAGQYARKAADSGFIGIVSTNSNPIVAPTHTAVPALGSNPIAVAAGYGDDQLDYDAATSTVSLGKIEIHEKTGTPIDADWAVDARGSVSHDPAAIMDGIRSKPRRAALTPLGGPGENGGGYKGYGLGLAVELLTGLLGDAPASIDLKGTRISHGILVISPRSLRRQRCARRARLPTRQTPALPALQRRASRAVPRRQGTRRNRPAPRQCTDRRRDLPAGAGYRVGGWILMNRRLCGLRGLAGGEDGEASDENAAVGIADRQPA
ncbi:malate dehydrogenase [Bifidobacterium thermophilum]|nr:malate dehydrogenase [Bifidobacterium thermophilum]